MSRGPMSRGPVSRGPVSRGPVSCGPMNRGPVSRGPFELTLAVRLRHRLLGNIPGRQRSCLGVRGLNCARLCGVELEQYS
ncbi:hypothetical protein WMY93_032333 [Mugilogobius chulae]|uniref:Uncharacterized protein n=1 Tax=Mugilogobius chulae TaxID=88201 RepID=A0AAW0MRV0_9GOBI